MADVRIFDPSWLREKATQCRDIAKSTSSQATAEELREIAVDYDADAANIERELRESDRSSIQPQS